jgi:pimeloyl-ACP methyl ester carboxylesterase
MPHTFMTEEPLQFGEGGRLVGVLTLPREPPRAVQAPPVFVFLNAGLLHRVGPFRLHVRLARALARSGFSSLRVDLAGVGDSPPRPGLANHESVAADVKEIRSVLESRLGRTPLVLAGLCSGADNAIRLAPAEPQVVGMVLLDPYCFPDAGFRARAVVAKYTDPIRYLAGFKRRVKALRLQPGDRDETFDYVAIRNLPTQQQLRAAFAAVRERKGQVLAVFTQYAWPYYNQAGQLERVLAIEGFRQSCTELYWPHVEHTYQLEVHRDRLIEEIMRWTSLHWLRQAPVKAFTPAAPPPAPPSNLPVGAPVP